MQNTWKKEQKLARYQQTHYLVNAKPQKIYDQYAQKTFIIKTPWKMINGEKYKRKNDMKNQEAQKRKHEIRR